ncbi:Uncharacterised protein [Mycobacteroides abscessus subsp. abscessus]|nr:Uncharacterised protein [Mycobacteroides abscessus subsp. abscessus]
MISVTVVAVASAPLVTLPWLSLMVFTSASPALPIWSSLMWNLL